jgi:hypothetical protein
MRSTMEVRLMDLVYLGLLLAFFGLTVGLVELCARLRGGTP